ncbi:VanZ family protein [Paenibacillus albus]|uniref:VanZ family protein n=1 Tax=Paenibacillus albus TaxID=2495582 RepID=UPI0013E0D827|nr:VanZ family protein [Paenibacillus albus]
MNEIKISRTLLYILPVALWVALILHFSSQSYQAQTIKPFLQQHFNENHVRAALPDITIHYNHGVTSAKLDPYGFIEFIFRKSAHLFVYGMLAIVLYVTLIPLRWKAVYRFFGALVALVVVASFDEWNQLSSVQRTGTYRDVIVDLAGGTIFLLLALTLGRGISYIRSRSSRRKY